MLKRNLTILIFIIIIIIISISISLGIYYGRTKKLNLSQETEQACTTETVNDCPDCEPDPTDWPRVKKCVDEKCKCKLKPFPECDNCYSSSKKDCQSCLVKNIVEFMLSKLTSNMPINGTIDMSQCYNGKFDYTGTINDISTSCFIPLDLKIPLLSPVKGLFDLCISDLKLKGLGSFDKFESINTAEVVSINFFKPEDPSTSQITLKFSIKFNNPDETCTTSSECGTGIECIDTKCYKPDISFSCNISELLCGCPSGYYKNDIKSCFNSGALVDRHCVIGTGGGAGFIPGLPTCGDGSYCAQAWVPGCIGYGDSNDEQYCWRCSSGTSPNLTVEDPTSYNACTLSCPLTMNKGGKCYSCSSGKCKNAVYDPDSSNACCDCGTILIWPPWAENCKSATWEYIDQSAIKTDPVYTDSTNWSVGNAITQTPSIEAGIKAEENKNLFDIECTFDLKCLDPFAYKYTPNSFKSTVTMNNTLEINTDSFKKLQDLIDTFSKEGYDIQGTIITKIKDYVNKITSLIESQLNSAAENSLADVLSSFSKSIKSDIVHFCK